MAVFRTTTIDLVLEDVLVYFKYGSNSNELCRIRSGPIIVNRSEKFWVMRYNNEFIYAFKMQPEIIY
ncbi:MAG: hypothetical protein QXP93_05550 [Nitrososphaerota archaeon]